MRTKTQPFGKCLGRASAMTATTNAAMATAQTQQFIDSRPKSASNNASARLSPTASLN